MTSCSAELHNLWWVSVSLNWGCMESKKYFMALQSMNDEAENKDSPAILYLG